MIWEESLECLPHVIDTAYFVSAARDDPLGAGFDGLNTRGMALWHGQFREALDHFEPNTFSQVAQQAATEANETDYDARTEHHAETYAKRLDLDESGVLTGTHRP